MVKSRKDAAFLKESLAKNFMCGELCSPGFWLSVKRIYAVKNGGTEFSSPG